MTNLKFLKTLTAGVALAMATCPQAWADNCGAGYVKGVISGDCVPASGSCGSGCSYTLDSLGNLNITGTGEGVISDKKFRGNVDIIKTYVGEGIVTIGNYAFANTTNMQNAEISDSVTNMIAYSFANSGISTIKLPKNLTSFDTAMINGCSNLAEINLPRGLNSIFGMADIVNSTGLTKLVIPDTVTCCTGGSTIRASNSKITFYCTQAQIDIGICSNNVTKYERDGDNLIVYNSNGTIKGIYSDYIGITHDQVVNSYEKENETSGMTDKYDGRGNFLQSYLINPDGSTSIYDASGKLTGLKNAKSITPAEAAALVKKGNHNTVTLTFK